jgi:hypothetical protein
MPLRISIRGMMAFVVCVAVVFASLLQPTEAWADGMFTLAVLVYGIALLAILLGPRWQRAAWVGAIVFGIGYLALALFIQDTPRLLTTTLIDEAYLKMSHQPTQAGERVWVVDYSNRLGTGFVEAKVIRVGTGRLGTSVVTRSLGTSSTASGIRALSLESFRQLVHSGSSLLLAFVGALVGRYFAARREATDGPGADS